jgi:hypothetical protein
MTDFDRTKDQLLKENEILRKAMAELAFRNNRLELELADALSTIHDAIEALERLQRKIIGLKR